MAPAATLQSSNAYGYTAVPTKQFAVNSITSNTAEHNEDVLREIRCLAADLVQQFKGGHPGTAMGAASIGMALWGSAMRFNPADGTWPDRDRFVLSAGHACLLQYMYLHLTGYKAWTMDMLKHYHSPDFKNSLAAGHPEIDPENGIEVTTGPLGQGISNSVGLAIASKHMAAHYNKPGFDIVANTIWCFTGDGCIAEGVGVEGLSLAGHLGLDNLVLVYDCNKITVDGTIDSYASEDHPAKLRSMGWNVLEVDNGSTDVVAIVDALDRAKNLRNGKPTCVQIRTIIGYGSQKQDTKPVHGVALGDEDVKHVKRTFGADQDAKFHLSQKTYDTFAGAKTKGAQLQAQWQATFEAYRKQYPELAKQFEQRNVHGDAADASGELVGGLPKEWTTMLPPKSELPTKAIPTRQSSGLAVQALVPHFPQFMVGSADLLDSTFVSWADQVEFQSPLKPELGGSFAGRQIRYGIREHAMAAIANGLAGYSTNGFIPVISTFFMFFLYAAPAIRMTALQKLRLIGIATHDSIGIGEDGPTHQPVGLAALFRAIPNVQFMRPADAEEVMGAWELALQKQTSPSILSLSRHALPLLPGSDRKAVHRGAYIVHTASSENANAIPLTLVATGSEVSVAIAAADLLATRNYAVKVVSIPCMSLFDAQPASYRHSVISPDHLSIGIEAWAALPWPRYTGASLSMHTFGHSGPQQQLFEMFGFAPENVAEKVDQYATSRIQDGKVVLPRIGEFEELLLGYAEGH
ncbi:Transketolase, C-terminal [Kalmanozyma brasiliensis GHG001]|uniref:transketolase n=1 Tax=Kalmanozyma brasiliensis (strain GHG001) TaxID=1365824 RepID=V5EVI2_KALBG|nr:Transketolase, C-terminal [Kalmanozyma brasiliensis GHG001]EST07263.1 Transketolase, C-terminal [Kalmanozyma brasiliensis GHG001]